MEIKEIVNYFMNKDSNLLEVSFRTINDSDEVLRNDIIDYSIVEDYGYDLITESFNFFEDDSDEDFEDLEEIELDEDDLISFLNEYYTVNPHKIPKSSFY
jgi:hypothetical protein